MHLVCLPWQHILTAAVAGAVVHLVWVTFPEPCRHQTPAHGGQHALICGSILSKKIRHWMLQWYTEALKMLHVCFVMQRFNILCSFPCLIEMSLWQQDGTLGLWTLVVRGFVFICISILPSGLSSPPRSVSVYTCSAHLVGSKSACGSSTHFSSGPC